MHTVKMLVTPSQAKEWLESSNNKNRTLNKHRASSYASDMKAGNWHLTHQGIAFYSCGNLADGQHRLMAIVLSGCSVEMMVSFGIEHRNAAGIDVHRARATADVIKIAELGDWIGKNEAAIAKIVSRANGIGTGTPTASQIVDFCNRNRESLEFVRKAFTSATKFLTCTPVKAGVLCAYGNVDSERLFSFCRQLHSGIIESIDDVAVIRLRERLLSTGAELQSGAAGRIVCMKLTSRAIKAFCGREQIGKLIAPKDFVFPIPSFG